MQTKQVIVMRKDLNMRKGKMIAQGAHASMAFITKRLQKVFPQGLSHVVDLDYIEQHWLAESFTKICVSVDSEQELLDIAAAAVLEGVTHHLVTDNGLTEFGGVPTHTCLALGPDEAEKIDRLTGDLRLL
jgi:PTH2 family peptidyl-tRNA hydrolase